MIEASMRMPVAAMLVSPAPNVTIALYSSMSGMTEKAIRRKIEDGKWIEGREYFRDPDGCIKISVLGVKRWEEKATA